MSNFRPINRTGFLLPPLVDEWVPQRHLARFVMDVVDGLDLSELEKSYRGAGPASYHPAMLLELLVYGYATGVFSSRALERATYDSVVFRFIAGNEHPDHDTIAHFRKRFLKHTEPLFVEVLKVARTMGILKMGTVALDGIKVHANANRDSALSCGHLEKLEKRLKKDVQELLRLAERADVRDIPDGMSIPEEFEPREACLAVIAGAKAKIKARVAEREHTEYQEKLAARKEKERRTGMRPGGPLAAPPSGSVDAKEQLNLTDEDSRIMRIARGGFDQCCNAQAVVAPEVTQAANEKEQLAPMLEKLKGLPKGMGHTRRILADRGYASNKKLKGCAAAGIEPLIALKRERLHKTWRQRFAPAPKRPPVSASAMQKVRYRLKAPPVSP